MFNIFAKASSSIFTCFKNSINVTEEKLTGGVEEGRLAGLDVECRFNDK